jgi:hypothetical protein
MYFTNRHVLIGMILFGVQSLRGQAKFWNVNDPAAYSGDESRQLISNSPWAKTTRTEEPGVDSIAPVSSYYDCGALVARRPPVCGLSRQTPVIESPPTPDAKTTIVFYGEVIVRWESAAPILQITRISLPDEFRDHYVIGVTGLPASLFSNTSTLTTQAGAQLIVRKRPPHQADFIALTSDKRTLLFAFPKASVSVKSTDKAIGFNMSLKGIVIKTQFDPREMVYHGRPAL